MNTQIELEEKHIINGTMLELPDGKRYKITGVSDEKKVRLLCQVCSGVTIYRQMDWLIENAKLIS